VSFSGIILLDEIPVEEFGYTESRHFSIPISTNAYAPGDEITVEIQVHRSEPYEMEDSETLTYIVGDGSPVFDDTNWGSLKSAY
jgi:hypothetical protein